MATILTGRIKNGMVELDNPSAALEGERVTVTIADASPNNHIERISFGMFKHWGEFGETDLKAAEADMDHVKHEFEG